MVVYVYPYASFDYGSFVVHFDIRKYEFYFVIF